MMYQDFNTLLKEHGTPCISVIVATEKNAFKKNYEMVKKSIQKAKALLKTKAYPEEIETMLMIKLDKILLRVPEEVEAGVGLYISKNVSQLILFPFPVTPKIVVDQKFEMRDLLYLQQFTKPYYVLNLSKHSVHLFKAYTNELEEIKDNDFPFFYVDQFEYQKASASDDSSGSLKSFEKDKNQISEIRLKSVFKDADAHLQSYLIQEDARLIVAGSQRLVNIFLGLTNFKKHFYGKISGSFDANNLDRLSDAAWGAFIRSQKKEVMEVVNHLPEERKGHLAEGIEQAWTAALEGKGEMLVVEKDFHHRGYQKPEQFKLYLHTPSKPYSMMPDVVSDLIETVSSKNGRVVFAENNDLKEFGHLALVLRY